MCESGDGVRRLGNREMMSQRFRKDFSNFFSKKNGRRAHLNLFLSFITDSDYYFKCKSGGHGGHGGHISRLCINSTPCTIRT